MDRDEGVITVQRNVAEARARRERAHRRQTDVSGKRCKALVASIKLGSAAASAGYLGRQIGCGKFSAFSLLVESQKVEPIVPET